MTKMPEHEKQFMNEANLIFDHAVEISESATERVVAFTASLAIIVKAMRRTPHNVRLEWSVDPDLFVKDTMLQAEKFGNRIRDNIKKYDNTRWNKLSKVDIDEAMDAVLAIFRDEEFAAFFKDFMVTMLNEPNMLETRFMRDWD